MTQLKLIKHGQYRCGSQPRTARVNLVNKWYSYYTVYCLEKLTYNWYRWAWLYIIMVTDSKIQFINNRWMLFCISSLRYTTVFPSVHLHNLSTTHHNSQPAKLIQQLFKLTTTHCSHKNDVHTIFTINYELTHMWWLIEMQCLTNKHVIFHKLWCSIFKSWRLQLHPNYVDYV